MTKHAHSSWGRLGGTAALVVGTIAVTLGGFLSVVTNSVYTRVAFADRTAASLQDAGVRAFVSDRVTNAIIGRKPDLIAVRPFVLSAAEGLVGTRPFEALVRTAAGKVHDVVFSEATERVVVALPDVGVLVRGVLEKASPALAEKVPPQMEQALTSLGGGGPSKIVLRALRLGIRLRFQVLVLVLGGLALLFLSTWLSPDRRRGSGQAGVGLAIGGLLLVGVVPVLRLVLGAIIPDPLTSGAVQGLASAYLGTTRNWGLAYLGLGLITVAGGAAFLDRFDPVTVLRRATTWLVTPPKRVLPRVGWGFAALAVGIAVMLRPVPVAAGLGALAGVMIAYMGLRELFRLVSDWVASVPAVETVAKRRGWSVPAMASVGVAMVAIVAAAVWLLLRNPLKPAVAPSAVTVCNGSELLCDRRVNEITFPGAHNAMSNQDSPDWMFPHHRAGMPQMLADGIRALAIDIHYGFPGGDRIKTDLSGGEGDKIAAAVGPEAVAIAERIRNTLVGADEGKRGLYFCHGFCELGAYEVGPVLAKVRDFLVGHPDEVVIVIIEDYVTPADLVKAFDQAGLTELVFQGPVVGQWPTLRTMITSNQRLIVFTESGKGGAPWLLPMPGMIQETPYTFHTREEFSCRPNRGGTTGALFLINHWIETTPTPKPSNAEIVNAHDVLLARARQCETERKQRPNILFVDFYRAGDVMGVAAELNGVAQPDSISK